MPILSGGMSVLANDMSRLAVLLAIVTHVTVATFPPVSNPPPIPGQGTLDTPGQAYFVQDEFQPVQPQAVVKDGGYFAPEPKVDEQRWYVSENQSGETGDFDSATELLDRYYADGQPAVGPVATPLPDDVYAAEPSGALKVLPEQQGSDIWVLTKGTNDQYTSQRWVPVQGSVQAPADKLVGVYNPDASPQVLSETVKSYPGPPPAPIKNPGPPVRQVWIRAPPQIQPQKIYQTTDALVEEIPSVKDIGSIPPSPQIKQYVQPQVIPQPSGVQMKQYIQPQIFSPPPGAKQYIQTPGLSPPPGIKQYIQPQSVKDFQPFQPPQQVPVISKKSSGFIVPPPPPPQIKAGDITQPQQVYVMNQPTAAVADKGGISYGKSSVVGQVRHIWIPTSQQTGKFITVPASDFVNNGKSISGKGIQPVNAVAPISVSDTWVLNQDGPLPRFEPQKTSFSGPMYQNGKGLVEGTPVLQFDSPKNPPLGGKSIDAPTPVNVFPVRKDLPTPQFISKAGFQPQPLATSLVKSGGIAGMNPFPISSPHKTYISNGRFLQPLQRPQILPPVASVIKGKPPCPIVPQKSIMTPRTMSVQPTYRTIAALRRPPSFSRIIRVNRYPYGSYYVLNPRIGPSLYAYPRPQAPFIQQAKNGAIRYVSARPVALPVSSRQLISLPGNPNAVIPGKSAPQVLYPSATRVRYAFPWGGYLRSLPVQGKSMYPGQGKGFYPIPPGKLVKKDDSSSSSSSESSSSESESKETKKKKKSEVKKPEAKKEAAVESEEAESEKVVETEAPAAGEKESEAEVEATSATETKESIEADENQFVPSVVRSPQIRQEGSVSGGKPFFNLHEKDQGGLQNQQNFVRNYVIRDQNGISKNVMYLADSAFFSARHFFNSAPRKSIDIPTNVLSSTSSPEKSTEQSKTEQKAEVISRENFTRD